MIDRKVRLRENVKRKYIKEDVFEASNAKNLLRQYGIKRSANASKEQIDITDALMTKSTINSDKLEFTLFVKSEKSRYQVLVTLDKFWSLLAKTIVEENKNRRDKLVGTVAVRNALKEAWSSCHCTVSCNCPDSSIHWDSGFNPISNGDYETYYNNTDLSPVSASTEEPFLCKHIINAVRKFDTQKVYNNRTALNIIALQVLCSIAPAELLNDSQNGGKVVNKGYDVEMRKQFSSILNRVTGSNLNEFTFSMAENYTSLLRKSINNGMAAFDGFDESYRRRRGKYIRESIENSEIDNTINTTELSENCYKLIEFMRNDDTLNIHIGQIEDIINRIDNSMVDNYDVDIVNMFLPLIVDTNDNVDDIDYDTDYDDTDIIVNVDNYIPDEDLDDVEREYNESLNIRKYKTESRNRIARRRNRG